MAVDMMATAAKSSAGKTRKAIKPIVSIPV
jgi:hypothetical protein